MCESNVDSKMNWARVDDERRNDSRIVDNKPPLYGRATLFNSIRETPAYKAFTAPFPIIVAVGRVFPNVGVDITSPIVSLSFNFDYRN